MKLSLEHLASDNVTLVQPKDWNRPRLLELLQQFSKKRVVILGDVGVDRYTEGTVDRISPEAPVPIVRVDQERLKLGLAANVADNIVELGGQCDLIGLVGLDSGFEDLKQLMKSKGLSSDRLIADPSRRTVVKQRIVSERQQLLRVDYENDHSVSQDIRDKVYAQLESVMAQADALIIEDYAKGLLSVELSKRCIQLAKRFGKPVLTDPNRKTSLSAYLGCTTLTPNRKEAEVLAKTPIRSFSDMRNAAQIILGETGSDSLVITLGRDGAALFKRGVPNTVLIPTSAREVYDVSGAGDTFISVLTLATIAGATLEEASLLGNIAAGVEVGKRGTATVTVDEIVHSMQAIA